MHERGVVRDGYLDRSARVKEMDRKGRCGVSPNPTTISTTMQRVCELLDDCRTAYVLHSSYMMHEPIAKLRLASKFPLETRCWTLIFHIAAACSTLLRRAHCAFTRKFDIVMQLNRVDLAGRACASRVASVGSVTAGKARCWPNSFESRLQTVISWHQAPELCESDFRVELYHAMPDNEVL